jgi:cullin-4
MQERLYQRLSAVVDVHLAQQLQQLQSYLGLDPVSFLDKVHVMWEDYCSQMLTIRSIFLVLDRSYVIGLPGLRSLFDTGLQLLRKHLEQHKKVRRSLLEGKVAVREKARNGVKKRKVWGTKDEGS